MKPPNYPVESVDNALKLLLALMKQPTMTVSEAGEMLGVALSTAHRLLATLQYRGFVDQDRSTRHYRAGPVLLKLGLTAARDLDLRGRARPVLERLSVDVGETAHLVVLQGSDILFIDSVESPNIVRVTSRMGVSLPAHCTAGGKALLAALSSAELRDLYPQARLSKMTSESLSRRSQLEQELADVRARGYATNFGESERGLVAIAAAIPGRGDRPLGAVAVAAPTGRIIEAQADEIGQVVLRAVKDIGNGGSKLRAPRLSASEELW